MGATSAVLHHILKGHVERSHGLYTRPFTPSRGRLGVQLRPSLKPLNGAACGQLWKSRRRPSQEALSAGGGGGPLVRPPRIVLTCVDSIAMLSTYESMKPVVCQWLRQRSVGAAVAQCCGLRGTAHAYPRYAGCRCCTSVNPTFAFKRCTTSTRVASMHPSAGVMQNMCHFQV